MALDVNGFRTAMSLRAAGVTVVTTQDRQGEPRGFTATAVCSVSLVPPLILVCIDRTAECYEAFQKAEVFAVNLLRVDQESLSRCFAQKTARKFAGIPHRTGVTGSPILANVLAHAECRVQARYPGGDHTILLGEAVGSGAASPDDGGSPLLHFRGGYACLTPLQSAEAL
jgi:flavin reductase ActVB